VAVEIAENGVDFTNDDVLFRYSNVPALVSEEGRAFFWFLLDIGILAHMATDCDDCWNCGGSHACDCHNGWVFVSSGSKK
jgi:hypothetical protein